MCFTEYTKDLPARMWNIAPMRVYTSLRKFPAVVNMAPTRLVTIANTGSITDFLAEAGRLNLFN